MIQTWFSGFFMGVAFSALALALCFRRSSQQWRRKDLDERLVRGHSTGVNRSFRSDIQKPIAPLRQIKAFLGESVVDPNTAMSCLRFR